MKSFVLLIGLFVSCGSFDSGSKKKVELKSWQSVFSYKDLSGDYSYKRWSKNLKDKVATKVEIYDSETSKLLEKIISVSLKNKEKLIPYQSQSLVWLESQVHESGGSHNLKTSNYSFQVKSNEPSWAGNKTFEYDSKQNYCYFNQIPECLVYWKIWKKLNIENKFKFIIIWEGFPFHSSQYSNIPEVTHSNASIKVSDLTSKGVQLELETLNQILFYNFDSKFNFEKMSWVAQAMELKRK